VSASDVDFSNSLDPPPLSAAGAAMPPAALGHACMLFRELVARYNISAADAQPLQQALASLGTGARPPQTVDQSLTASKSKAATAEAEEARLRTRVPVQLLTSTRRITEFSSARQPAEGDRIVYVSGSFDMFHVGHAQFLKDARDLGTFLFVGIHDDLAVSASKGANYPVMTLNERVLNVCACKWVDEVIIGAPRCVTADLIKTWNIHIVARGCAHQRDAAPRVVASDDGYEVARSQGIYREVPSQWPELCHDTIVQRIISDREAYLKRNLERAAKEDQYYSGKSQHNSPLEV